MKELNNSTLHGNKIQIELISNDTHTHIGTKRRGDGKKIIIYCFIYLFFRSIENRSVIRELTKAKSEGGEGGEKIDPKSFHGL